MAQKRMFNKSITNSSMFLMMPQSTQALYFHLGMNGDDDGFVEHYAVMKMTGSNPDDLKLLQVKKFIYIFDELVLVILDWKENNYIRSDRYTKSRYFDLYKDKIEQIRLTSGIPKVGIGKGSIDKDSIDKIRDIPFIKSIIDYLNKKTKKNLKYTTDKYQIAIMARKNDGYILEDFYKVIDNKSKDKWFCDEGHMNPITLFGTKFDKYLNEKLVIKQEEEEEEIIIKFDFLVSMIEKLNKKNIKKYNKFMDYDYFYSLKEEVQKKIYVELLEKVDFKLIGK